jgi:hypothetical protein
MEPPKNCNTCGYHTETKQGSHLCQYKHCNMGLDVFYKESIPENTIHCKIGDTEWIGCDWIPKKKKGLEKW